MIISQYAGKIAARAPEKLRRLASNNVQFPVLEEPFDPHAWFITCEGLRVSESFTNRVLSKAKPIKKFSGAFGKSFDLSKNAYDREIVPELPKGYVFGASELCARIAQKTKGQSYGTRGDLLGNDDRNIFYVAGVVARVVWSFDRCEWQICARKLDYDIWRAGCCRVFSRA